MYGKGKIAKNAKYNNKEFIGKKFGRLTVIDIFHFTDGKYQRWMWKCQCECGNIKDFRSEYVYNGHTTSCGCKLHENKTNMKHGESKTRLFRIWGSMIARCDEKRTYVTFRNRYALRGIKVCDEWKDYSEFARWAKNHGYNDNLTIERIDNDGNYCPENCKWIERGKQARNRGTTHYIEYNGVKMSLAEACEMANLPYKQVFARIKRLGWPVDEALSIPMGSYGRGSWSKRPTRF